MSEVTSNQIAEWRALQGEGMISAVGEYTPDEFWIVLDELADRDARIAELEGLLRHAQKQVPTGSGLHMRIDAALAAHRSTGVV